MKRHCRIREGLTHLSLSAPDRKRGLSPPPITDASLLVDSGRPMVTHRTRWCQGGTPHQGQPVDGGRVEGGSPQMSSGGEGRRRQVDDSDESGSAMASHGEQSRRAEVKARVE
jgi:hypothetical protein